MSGYCGIGVFHAKTEANIGTLMRSAYCFGASFVYTIGRRYQRQSSDTVNCGKQIPLYHYQTFEELTESLPIDCPLVGVELAPGAENVGSFAHPRRAVYLLGAEDHGIPRPYLARCHKTIVIPHAQQCLNVAVAGSIVLFDRQRQRYWSSPETAPVFEKQRNHHREHAAV